MKAPRTAKSLSLIARLFLEENKPGKKEDIFIAGYMQALKDVEEANQKQQQQEAKEQSLALSATDPTIPTFQEFWNLYDKKHDKTVAEKKWDKLTPDEKRAVMQHLPDYIASTQGDKKQFRRYPATYLNKRTWENDIDNDEQFTATSSPPKGNDIDRDFIASKSGLFERLNARRGGNNC